MVGAEKDDCIVGLSTRLQRRKYFTNLVVNEGYHGIVTVPGTAKIIVGHAMPMPPMREEQGPRGIVEIFEWKLANRRRVDLFRLIAVPILLGRNEWRVRTCE